MKRTLISLLMWLSATFAGTAADDLPPAPPALAQHQAQDQALVLPDIDEDEIDPETAEAFGRAGDAYGGGDFTTAIGIWKRLAEAGFGPALFNLGVMHEHGRGVRTDYAAAAGWYRRAALKEVPGAFVNLARLHVEGRGVKRDPAEAMHLLEQASQLGSAEAQFNLGAAYMKGLGAKADPQEAAVWFEMAAEQGHALAAYNLGIMYQAGKGIERDLAEAERYFSLGAEAGDALSHYALGAIMVDKPGNLKAAADHLRIAAEAGVVAAQNRLAILLATGKGAEGGKDGITRDRESALMWFHVAAGLGAANAAKNRDALAATLTDDVRARAKHRADAFRPKPVPPADSAAADTAN